ncbi:MAG: flagellar export chaperone FliS [Bacillota bacterium]
MEDKSQVLLMLYDGAIRFLAQAVEALQSRDYEGANRFIVRAQSVVSELKSALNVEYEVARSLSKLYDYFNRRLVEANERKESALLIEVQGYLKELRETWAVAIATLGAEDVPLSIAAAEG